MSISNPKKKEVDKWGLALSAGVYKPAEKCNSLSACPLLLTGHLGVRSPKDSFLQYAIPAHREH